MLCYKYMSYERFIQSIKPTGVFLKVSRPIEFNDPYDCTGIVIGTMSERLKNTYGKYFSHIMEPKELDLSVKVNGRRLFDGMYRILSLSDSIINETAEEMLMWSHYGDYGKGVRIGIEIDISRYRLWAVEYKTQLPQLDVTKIGEWDIFEDPELRRFLKACLLTKYDVWKYEQERRLVFRVNDSCLRPFPVIDAAGSIYDAMMIWHPDKNVIKEVCFGAEFLSPGKSYRDVDSYLTTLLGAGYDFKVYHAIKRTQCGFDMQLHDPCANRRSHNAGGGIGGKNCGGMCYMKCVERSLNQ